MRALRFSHHIFADAPHTSHFSFPSTLLKVNQINGLFFNCAGILQRDARPAESVNDEFSHALPEGGVDEKQIQVLS